MSRPFQRNVGPVVTINAKLLSCALLAGAAWYFWPVNWLEEWRSGVIGVLGAYGAAIAAVQAIKAMAALYTRDKAIAEFEAQGTEPKSSQMASRNALEAAGMLDD